MPATLKRRRGKPIRAILSPHKPTRVYDQKAGPTSKKNWAWALDHGVFYDSEFKLFRSFSNGAPAFTDKGEPL